MREEIATIPGMKPEDLGAIVESGVKYAVALHYDQHDKAAQILEEACAVARKYPDNSSLITAFVTGNI